MTITTDTTIDTSSLHPATTAGPGMRPPAPADAPAVAVAGDTQADVDVDAVLGLGALALAFGRVQRITRHENGTTPETDTDHTVMLGLLACAIAAQHLPQLDLGLVAQLALVHDLVEAYAGDTPTLRVTDGQLAGKAAREAAALARLHREFGTTFPWLTRTIELYEVREIPEARFVKALDKAVPKITHVLNGGATMRQQDLDVAEIAARYAAQRDELARYAGDFGVVLALREQLVDQLLDILTTTQPTTTQPTTAQPSTASPATVQPGTAQPGVAATVPAAAAAVRSAEQAGAELAEPGGLRKLGVELAVPVVATLPGTGSAYRLLGDGGWWLVEPLAEAAALDPAQVARLQPCGPPGPHLAARLTH